MFKLKANMRIAEFNDKYNPKPIISKKQAAARLSQYPVELSFGMSEKLKHKNLAGKTLNSLQGDKFCLHPNINYAISFGALKKTDFDGIDLAVVEKFKAPIEKFNSNEDLQLWAREKVREIVNKDYRGRSEVIRKNRNNLLNRWANHLNGVYKRTTTLLVLDAITKDLKNDNDRIPPVLNERVLDYCISEIEKNKTKDRSYQFNLNKMYQTQLNSLYIEDTKIPFGGTGWVVIPSRDNDRKFFDRNVEKLKTFSHKNWCTKSYNAESYLSEGDFHIYLENGQPKLGMRFLRGKIEEIQGELNNRRIPIRYFDEVKKYIDENNFNLSNSAEIQVGLAQETKDNIEKIKKDLKKAIEKKDAEAIFRYFVINVKREKHSLKDFLGLFGDKSPLIISHYQQPSINFSFSDIGIDEDMLFARVKRIRGNADFEGSALKSLKNLEVIGGNADFRKSEVADLGKLKLIGGSADFKGAQIKSLGCLEFIGGYAGFNYSNIKDLGRLKVIDGVIFSQYSHFKESDFSEIEHQGFR